MSANELKAALQSSSFFPLLSLVSRTLTRAGYGEVRFMGRRAPQQKSKDAGYDLLFEATFATRRRLVVVVKVADQPIRIRQLDEMCGVIHRTRADMGFVVSAHHVTRKAKALLPDYEPTVQAIDGEQLAALMSEYQIGTRGKGEVDYAFFGSLEHYSNKVLSFINRGIHE